MIVWNTAEVGLETILEEIRGVFLEEQPFEPYVTDMGVSLALVIGTSLDGDSPVIWMIDENGNYLADENGRLQRA